VDEVSFEDFEPIMPYPICPHCGTTQQLDERTYGRYKGPITCYACKGRYTVEFAGELFRDLLGQNQRSLQGNGGVMISPPQPLGDQTLLLGLSSPPLPTEMYRAFADAVTGLATSPPTMVAVLCRYIVQSALLIKGIPDEPPAKMVNLAAQRSLLSEMALQSCRAAVFMGGKGAHPQQDWVYQVGLDDAKQAVLATKRVLLELFNPDAVQDAI
ncbi:MAG: hypothetical protein O2803_14140, partial [Chloroflexi bacterium]|nr:hypothetical protein [Chloroflexota bacterium]